MDGGFSELLAVLLGAVASSLGGYFAARQIENARIRHENRQKIELEKSKCYVIVIKLMEICAYLKTIKEKFDNELPRAAQVHPVGEPIFAISDGPGLVFDVLPFSPDQFSILISNQEYNIVEGIFRAWGACVSVSNSLEMIFETRRSVFDVVGPQSFDGHIGSAIVPKEHFSKIAPKLVQVNTLIAQVVEQVDIECAKAVSVSRSFSLFCRGHFDDKNFPIATHADFDAQ